MYPKAILIFSMTLFLVIVIYSLAYSIDYRNSGMSCEEIGGFAQSVMYQKNMGETLNDKLIGLHQSLLGQRL